MRGGVVTLNAPYNQVRDGDGDRQNDRGRQQDNGTQQRNCPQDQRAQARQQNPDNDRGAEVGVALRAPSKPAVLIEIGEHLLVPRPQAVRTQHSDDRGQPGFGRCRHRRTGASLQQRHQHPPRFHQPIGAGRKRRTDQLPDQHLIVAIGKSPCSHRVERMIVSPLPVIHDLIKSGIANPAAINSLISALRSCKASESIRWVAGSWLCDSGWTGVG